MKYAKKLASMLLALAMVFALAISASAADHTYEIYQIFTGDYYEGVLSNVKWGQNGTGVAGSAVDKSVLEALEAVADSTSDTDKLEVITQYANLNSTPYRTGQDTQYNGLPNGYYLVKDQDHTQTDVEGGYYTLYIVQVVNGTLEFEPKGDVPTSDKKIVEGDKKLENNEASIGDTVDYEITGTQPTNIGDYNTYYYVFTDTLSKGLSYNEGTVRVMVGGVDVTKYFYVNATEYSETTGTTLTVGIQDLLALNLLDDVQITKDSKVVVSYTAILNEKAEIAGNGNPNDVRLVYSNDPNDSGDGSTTPPPENPGKPTPEHPTGKTPESEVVTYTTELTIKKTDENGGILAGAEFTLTGTGVKVVLVSTESFKEDQGGEYWKLADGTYTKTAPTVTGAEDDNSSDYDSISTKYSKTTEFVVKGEGKTETSVVGAVDSETGLLTFTGLGEGTYTITESKTPSGYNTIAPITFNLTFDVATHTFQSDGNSVVVGSDNKLDTRIINEAGSELASTGGVGTTLFYIVGGVLVLAAVVLLVTKRRMGGKE